jgi:uncharacterized iron-regulated protein
MHPLLRLSAAVAALLVCLALAACRVATPTPSGAYAWERQLSGDRLVLLGEVHDNAVQHGLRLAVLQRALARGWRPAIVMEQLDTGRQADIERARRERPEDAQHVIDLAASGTGGWNWDFYRPYIALALQYRLPLLAGNLSRADAQKVVQDGYAAVFDPARLAALGLDSATPPPWQAAQEREIDVGHCHALPRALLPAMARAQLARDALMADIVAHQETRGVVLLAGDGHVRRDLGVPRWLSGPVSRQVLSVGFLEHGDPAPPDAYDQRVYTVRQDRPDPCEPLRHPPPLAPAPPNGSSR